MNLHLIQNAEMVETHKNLIKRSRYLEFEFHTLFLKLDDFISPYFEQNVIPSEENGYKDFLIKFEGLLNQCREANLHLPVIDNILDRNNVIFDEKLRLDYVDYSVFKIIHNFFNGVKQTLSGVASKTAKIIKEIDDFMIKAFDKNNENISGVDTEVFAYIIRKQMRLIIPKYEKWLGVMPVLPENPTAEDFNGYKKDMEYLNQYISSLIEVRKKVKETLDIHASDILLNDLDILLGERMVGILEVTDLNSLRGSKYGEAPITYSHIERAVIARSYTDLMFRYTGRNLESAKVHQDRIAYMQYFLEKEVCGVNAGTQMVEKIRNDLKLSFQKGSDGTEEGNKKFEALTLEYHKQMSAYDFAEKQINNTTPYSDALNTTHKRILALVTAIYKEFGYAIYHNPRLLENLSSYRLRFSGFFVYQHPNVDLNTHKVTKPFHINDGVMERHILESLCNMSFDPLTFEDIIGILDKKYRKSVELFTLMGDLERGASTILSNLRDAIESTETLTEKSDELKGIVKDLGHTAKRFERLLNTTHDNKRILRRNV